MSINDMKARFMTARGVDPDTGLRDQESNIEFRSRARVVDEASFFPDGVDVDESDLVHIEVRARTIPPGDKLRTLAAGAGISLVELLQDLDLWPPLLPAADNQRERIRMLRSVCRDLGASVSLQRDGSLRITFATD